MARASAWATGRALAYRDMELEEQAELFCLFHAAKVKDGEEAKGVLLDTAGEIAYGFISALREARAAPGSEGGTAPAPTPVTRGHTPGRKDRVTGAPLPDIIRSRLPPDLFSSRV